MRSEDIFSLLALFVFILAGPEPSSAGAALGRPLADSSQGVPRADWSGPTRWIRKGGYRIASYAPNSSVGGGKAPLTCVVRTGKCLLQAQQRLRRDNDATGLAKSCDIIGRFIFPIVKRPSSQPFCPMHRLFDPRPRSLLSALKSRFMPVAGSPADYELWIILQLRTLAFSTFQTSRHCPLKNQKKVRPDTVPDPEAAERLERQNTTTPLRQSPFTVYPVVSHS